MFSFNFHFIQRRCSLWKHTRPVPIRNADSGGHNASVFFQPTRWAINAYIIAWWLQVAASHCSHTRAHSTEAFVPFGCVSACVLSLMSITSCNMKYRCRFVVMVAFVSWVLWFDDCGRLLFYQSSPYWSEPAPKAYSCDVVLVVNTIITFELCGLDKYFDWVYRWTAPITYNSLRSVSDEQFIKMNTFILNCFSTKFLKSIAIVGDIIRRTKFRQ